MICDRCIMTVRHQLILMGIMPISVELGEITLNRNININELTHLELTLKSFGFEVLKGVNSLLINDIKDVVAYLLYTNEYKLDVPLSEFISIKLNNEYSFLNSVFSEIEGKSIEAYFTFHKIERVKELIVYNNYSLTEIAKRFDYKSINTLSKQFEKQTGLTPSYFKKINNTKMKVEKITL